MRLGFPLPQSWKESASRVLEGSLSKNSEDYFAVDFRSRFHEAIGHRYVLDLQRILTVDFKTKKFTRAEWGDKLGVNRTTVHRWNKDEVFAGAENFFAAQLLILNVPIGTLPLSPNDDMLRNSILSMMRYLRTHFIAKDKHRIPTNLLSDLVALMRAMADLEAESAASVYNPFDPTKEHSNDGALDILTKHADHLAKARLGIPIPPKGAGKSKPIVLKSEVQSWFEHWGIPYSIFGMGYDPTWMNDGGLK